MKAFKMPFIKFPQDWEIKFIVPHQPNDPSLFRFFVKKDETPNIVVVSIFEEKAESEWEILVASFNEDDDVIYFFGTIRSCAIDDVDRLIKIIEELFHTENMEDNESLFDYYEEE
jgi:hypothetical protein